MSGAVAPPSPKVSGEAVEAIVCNRVPTLVYVSDLTAEWHDARVDGLLEPTSDIQFVGINLLATGTVVEIKAAQRRYASGCRGRFFVRKRQHERLVDEAGAYLFAIYERAGTDHDVVGMVVMAATTVDGLLPDGWTAVDGDRSEEGYRQLAWSRVLDPEVIA